MKELSIEEKAKAYDEAIKVAKSKIKYNKDHVLYEEEDITDIFPELKESEDERIRKAISQCVEDMRGQFEKLYKVHHKDAIAWLEKQGEHANFLNKIQIGDKVTRNEDGVLVNLSQLNRVAKKNENQSDKPQGKTALKAINEEKVDNANKIDNTNKDELRFHIGDWIINNSTKVALLIKSYNSGYCKLEDINGNTYSPCMPPTKEDYHLWSIDDAKTGDILASKDGKDILIFRHLSLDDDNTFLSYCSINFSSYYNLQGYDEHSWRNTNFVPAAKEQRDLLFQKMKEAGYEWDAEKKEFKRIEQKPSWSEEDERMYRGLHNLIYSTPYCDSRKELSDWFKSIKDRVIPQSKQEWGEKDEYILNNIYDFVAENLLDKNRGVCADECLKWLKSLRPQNRWKPSDEQIRRLEYFVKLWGKTEDTENTKVFETVKSLLNDLKQLKQL